MKPKFAISYSRFSSKEQSKGDSLRRQLEATQAYCERMGLILLDQYADKGISAFHGANADEGALNEIIQLAKSGSIPKGTVLIVESLDRISRQEINRALRLFLEILENGLDIVTLSDGERHYSHQKTELVDLIVSLVVLSRAHEESATKSHRIIESWKARRKQAKENGKIITSVCPSWLKAENGKFKPIPERVKMLKRIFKMSVDDNLGSHAIAKILNSEKIKPWESVNSANKSGLWSKTYITKLLCNRATIGEHQPRKRIDGKLTNVGEPIIDYYPAVIDSALFYRNQSKREKRKLIDMGRPSSTKDYNLFKGLIVCANCGKPLQMTSKSTKKSEKIYRYLFCSGNCGAPTAKYERFERLTLYSIPAVDSREMELVNKGIQSRNEARDGKIIEMKAELKALQARWKKSKSDTILSMIEETENEIKNIENEMEIAEPPVKNSILERVKSVQQMLKSDDQSWRAEFRDTITRIIKRVEYDTKTETAKIQLVNGERYTANYDHS